MENISTIIFDLGGVIMDIDVKHTLKAFADLGLKNVHEYFGHGFAASFFSEHEAGRITDEEFVQEIKKLIDIEVPDKAVIEAWNALLLRFPPERIALLEELKNRYRLFLFSNTNAIHKEKFDEIYNNSFPGNLDDLFEKAYYSHELGHRKPDLAGFELIIRENRLDPKQTLFVDDALLNVEGAIKTGLKGLYLPPGLFITDIKW
ncbi:MAG: HAD family phosphatase [Bacteroidota bacterium]|nr:HAD family phosphatase [Bacteroidota bacterium]